MSVESLEKSELFISPTSPIMITGFQVRDPHSHTIYFSRGFQKDVGEAGPIAGVNPALGISYLLPSSFLQSQQIASQVQFNNQTDLPLQNFQLKETHFLGTQLLQEFAFDLCFVPPRTQNTWEHIYVPEFRRDKAFMEKATKGPWNVHTQLFINGELIMHTKAQLQFK